MVKFLIKLKIKGPVDQAYIEAMAAVKFLKEELLLDAELTTERAEDELQ